MSGKSDTSVKKDPPNQLEGRRAHEWQKKTVSDLAGFTSRATALPGEQKTAVPSLPPPNRSITLESSIYFPQVWP